jgi:hypothetical protein
VRELNARLERVLTAEGSSRSASLLRIGLAILVLDRFAPGMQLGKQSEPRALLLMLCYWTGVCALLIGYRSQLAAAISALTLGASVRYLGGVLHQDVFRGHHHVYLLLSALGCLAFTPCGRSYSLDRWRQLERDLPLPPERGPTWALRLMAVQLSAVYFWGAFDKTSAGWLSGAKLESQLLATVFDSDPPSFAGWHALLAVAAVFTALLEYALALGLWFRAGRRWLIPLGIAFHLLIYATMPVSIFSALACMLYIAYVDPDDVHAAIERLSHTG